MDSQVPEVSITELFDQFIEATTMRNILSLHHRILNYADLNPCEFNVFFPKLKRAVTSNKARKSWKAKTLFSKIDKKASHKCYSNTKTPSRLGNNRSILSEINQNNSQENLSDNTGASRIYNSNNALSNHKALIIGSGPAGLRTAIELQLLGASKVVVVEKRSRFSRNNVLHLWPFVIDDLKSLGAKKFYGKFCAGSIDHISIRQLQLILLKICLMIGCDFRDSCSYVSLCPASIKETKVTTEEQLLINGNESDIKKSNSDSSDGTTQRCDLCDVLQQKQHDDNFLKVPDQNLIESEGVKTDNDHTTYNDVENSFTTSDSMRAHEGSLLVDQDKITTLIGDEKLHGDLIIKDLNTQTEVNFLEEEEHHNKANHLKGARAHFNCDTITQEKELHEIDWDIVVGADGRHHTLSKFFPRKEFRGRLAIAITANFINRQTPAEASVSEISGLSFIYNQDMFNALAYDTNIELENICYYKDDTHYFVMTAKKKSLLERGVLIKDYPVTQDLLSENNVDRQALLKYAKDAAFWTTGLEPLDFALNHYGQEDCAMFDFTSMYAATNACKALRTHGGGLTLVTLVGDSLLEPFWPTGSGCARGFLSSFDAAWMCRQWSVNNCAVLDYHDSLKPTTYNRMALSVMAERESIYRILAQTTSENLHQNYTHWTLNPHSRYPNLNRHLVMPSQVEHLISDSQGQKLTGNDGKKNLSPKVTRRVKSPYNGSHRRSPKKMKSTNSLATKDSKNDKTRPKMRFLSKRVQDFRSKPELALDDEYYEYESSYRDLSDGNYLNHRRPNCDIYDDYFIPSISGTLPSSNNLLSLEARRARDIDECLRQRRQKNQISAVRDQLVDKFKKNASGSCKSIDEPSCGAALFNELRKLREQQVRDKENRNREATGPLTLLNSMRRCASFAERVKSFESKLVQNESQTTPTTPKIPIDNVKHLPEFATLQELFVNNSRLNNDRDATKKVKMPIMKLSKDDWNVKCWEKRLAAYRNKNSKEMSSSTKSLNRAFSVDSEHPTQNLVKPEKQVEVFRGRIREMADKLKSAKDKIANDYHKTETNGLKPSVNKRNFSRPQVTNGAWVSHLRRELTKGAEPKTPQQQANVPTKLIKKLFQNDDDDDDDGKHYDHLCVNRPTNKYLKNGYKSHLTRTRYDSATSKVINCEPTKESKLAYMKALTSRGSSVSSTLSEYSSSGNGTQDDLKKKHLPPTRCLRCDKVVNPTDKITIDSVVLHRVCLTCANCGISLRANEIAHYISIAKQLISLDGQTLVSFDCSICKPDILKNSKGQEQDITETKETKILDREIGLRSREEFLNQKINYNELYKNILYDKSTVGTDARTNDFEEQQEKIVTSTRKSSLNLSLNTNKEGEPFRVKLDKEYTVATSETIDGSEQVTLMLPGDFEKSKNPESKRPLIDEEEFQRILHLDSKLNDEDNSSQKGDEEDESSDDHGDDDDETSNSKESESSSLQSPLNSDSTCEDFSTVEEFVASDDEFEVNEINSDIISNSIESSEPKLN